MCLGTAGSVHLPLGVSISGHTCEDYVSARAYLTPRAPIFMFGP